MLDTKYKDINGVTILVGDELRLNLGHFKKKGIVIQKNNQFLIQWSKNDFSELNGDHLYSEKINNGIRL
jgi:hypothetical protein